MSSAIPGVMTAVSRMPLTHESRKRQSERTMLTTDGNELKMRKSRSCWRSNESHLRQAGRIPDEMILRRTKSPRHTKQTG
jgi:hypothetical protein